MVAQDWKWSDLWSFFQGLGGLAVAVGALAAGVQFLKHQFGRPAIIVRYWSEASTPPPGLLDVALAMADAARNVVSFFVGEGSEVVARERLRMAAYTETVGRLLESRPIDRIDTLRITVHNASRRTVSGSRLFDDGAIMQFLTLNLDGDFLAPRAGAQFHEAVQWKPGLLLPPLPDIPAGGNLRLSIYGLVDPGRELRVTTHEGLRVRVQRLVQVPRRRFFQREVSTWE